jgi:hypothetical protein
MEGRIDPPEPWPLSPGALTCPVLSRFAPLSYSAVKCGYNLGFIDDENFYRIVKDGLVPSVSPLLEVFVKTAHYIDRRRDIHDELERLAASELSPHVIELWMVLARIVLIYYRDEAAAMRMIDAIFGWCDNPDELRPFTSYSELGSCIYPTAADVIVGLNAVLSRHGV